jgi:hypothetical protein
MAKEKARVTSASSAPLTLDGLDDLDKDEVFPFRGKEYIIPAISQTTSEILTELSSKLRPALEKEDVKTIVKFDIEYVATAMDGGKATEETMEMLRDWPKKVLSRLSLFISGHMMGPVAEDIPEEKEAEAKKS